MAVCHVSVVESLSQSWLRFLTVVRGRKPEDDMRRATMMLTSSIQATSSIEREIGSELAELSCRARTLRNKHVKADLVALLTSSKHKRLRLQQTVRKRLALEQHLETLQSTLLNQQVMNSVKHTSDVLKSMGLENEVSRIEEVNLDLREALTDVGAIQEQLAAGGLFGTNDDMDLESEMQLLMELDPTYAYTLAALPVAASASPPQINSMPAEPVAPVAQLAPGTPRPPATPPAELVAPVRVAAQAAPGAPRPPPAPPAAALAEPPLRAVALSEGDA